MKFIKSVGIGGRLKQRIEDFVVEEIPKEMPPGDEYTLFWMEKFNWDTHKAVKEIAKRLHVSFKRIGFAGTKDRRAVTKQRLSIWKIEPKKLEQIKIKDIKLYGFEKSSERINLGDLKGNKFIVTIRDVDLSDNEIKKRLSDIFSELEKGIPNIYGYQRFGEIREVTHLVGKAMLKGNFQEAVKIYLTQYFENEKEDSKEARKLLRDNWGKEGFKNALQMFPIRLRYERSMLEYLYRLPNDYAGSLRRLPKKLRKMFINAFQAYIWNKTVENLEHKQQKIPLVGCDTKLDEKNPIHKRIKMLLEEENITQKNFLMESMPELKTTGSERDFLLMPKDLKLLEIADDEFNENKKKVKISFELPPGSYATVVLNEIIN